MPWSICTPTTCLTGPWPSGRWDLPIIIQGDLAEAGRAYTEAYSLAQAAGDIIDSLIGFDPFGPGTGS